MFSYTSSGKQAGRFFHGLLDANQPEVSDSLGKLQELGIYVLEVGNVHSVMWLSWRRGMWMT